MEKNDQKKVLVVLTGLVSATKTIGFIRRAYKTIWYSFYNAPSSVIESMDFFICSINCALAASLWIR